jgi:hypothetical protein
MKTGTTQVDYAMDARWKAWNEETLRGFLNKPNLLTNRTFWFQHSTTVPYCHQEKQKFHPNKVVVSSTKGCLSFGGNRYFEQKARYD